MQGSVRQRERGVWEVRVYKGKNPTTGKKRYISRTVRGTKRDAQLVARDLVHAAEHARADEANAVAVPVTFGEWLDKWWVEKKTTLSPSSVSPWRSAIQMYLKPNLGERMLGDLRVGDLEALYRRLVDNGLSPARVQKIHTVASVALKDAVRHEFIKVSPAVHARAPRGQRTEPDPPSPQEVQRLLAAAESADPALFAFLVVAANTGARRGELCALRWVDVNVDGGHVTIAQAVVKGGGDGAVVRQTKTGAATKLAVTDRVLEVLEARRCERRDEMENVGLDFDERSFIWAQDPEGTRPIYPDSISARFRRLRESEGLEHVQLRQLRHFVATQLLGAGVDIRTVAGRLGHSRPATTLDRYAAFLPVLDREAAEILDRVHAPHPD